MEKRRKVRSEQLEELFAELWQLPSFTARRGFRPQVDCYRSDDPPAVTVVVDLPGIEPDDVEITLTERETRLSYRQMELEYGPFQRRVSLAEDVDPDHAEAHYERGQLTVVMPLARKPAVGRILIVLGERRGER
jgi:HSP20 family molecular chaperone IbpA